jgi:hypothetical protein
MTLILQSKQQSQDWVLGENPSIKTALKWSFIGFGGKV